MTATIEAPIATTFSLSASAAKRILRITADEPAGTALRITVKGGGCQGFSYGFDLTAERTADELVVERDGATVLVDTAALDLIAGSELDFVDNLIGQSFQITNPNAASTCGCGTSFSV
ncbi:MAG: iron-sulfur cluster assembly accessory protein [Ancalomicrobiaceae bacterium]|nr:iron-sulfur cluster assembly accessory protein [Ancalomicrobiaceae bacterium]